MKAGRKTSKKQSVNTKKVTFSKIDENDTIETEAMQMANGFPTGDAAGLSITNDRRNPRIPWIQFSRWSFASDEDWEAVCEMADCNPNEVDTVKIYIHDIVCE